ncbi:MAG: CHAT domain-containing protein [Nonlabens sp.]
MRLIIFILCVASFLTVAQNLDPTPFPYAHYDHPSYDELRSAVRTGNKNGVLKHGGILMDRYDQFYNVPADIAYALLGTAQQNKASIYARMAMGTTGTSTSVMNNMYFLSMVTQDEEINQKAFELFVYSCLLNGKPDKIDQSLNKAIATYASYPDSYRLVKKNLAAQTALTLKYQNIIDRCIRINDRYKSIPSEQVNAMLIEDFKIIQKAHQDGAIDDTVYVSILVELAFSMKKLNISSDEIISEMIGTLSRKRYNPYAQYELYLSIKKMLKNKDDQRLIEVIDVFINQSSKFLSPQLDDLYLEKLKALRRLKNMEAFKTVMEAREERLKSIKNPLVKVEYLISIYAYYMLTEKEKGDRYFKELERLVDMHQLEDQYQEQLDIFRVQNGSLKNIESEDAQMLYSMALADLHKHNYSSMLSHLKRAEAAVTLEMNAEDGKKNIALEKLHDNILIDLVGAYIKNGRSSEALKWAESFKNKKLNSQLSSKNIAPINTKEIQNILEEDEILIYYFSANTQSADGLFVIAVTNTNIIGEYFDGTAYSAEMFNRFQKHANYTEKKLAKRELRAPTDTKRPKFSQDYIPSPGDQRVALEMYRSYLAPDKEDIPYQSPSGLSHLSKRLFKLYLPQESTYNKYKKIIISPAGNLSFIPFETLTNLFTGRMMIEDYQISYTPSASVLKALREEKPKQYSKNVLAFGDARYSLRENSRQKVASIADVKRLQLQLSNSIAKDENLDYAFAALQGKEPMKYLVGTKNEVEAIAQIVPNTDLRLNNQMTENELKSMSKSGALKDYRILHLASHASVNPYIFELSGLAMSVFPSPVDGEDGMITIAELEQLEMNPELVMLSACETGLGRIVQGDTVQGLNNALLMAGANGTLTSLWPVNDYATSLFVKDFYTAVFSENMDYPTAVAYVKRKFIRGNYGEQLKHPKYWAPFIYYGK